MKHVSFALRICISAGVALAALAPRTGLAESPACTAPGMARLEREAGVSGLDSSGTWLRLLPGTGQLVDVAPVATLEPCLDPDIWVSPDGEQLITWQFDREILSVTSERTALTKLPFNETLWAADVVFDHQGRAVIAAMLARDGEEPRLTIIPDAAPGAGTFLAPVEVTGADCGRGTTAAAVTSAGEVVVLCQGSFTAVTIRDGSFNMVTFPLELEDIELVVAEAEPEPITRATFFAIIEDRTDNDDESYDLVRIRLSAFSNQNIDLVLEDIAYVGGDHGLAVIDDLNAVYMDEEGLVQVVGSRYDDWSSGVIHRPRPGAKLSALAGPPRVLISEYDAELLTLTGDGWEHETLFALGTPPAPAASGDGGGGCSMAGVDPATGLGQVLLVMLALALVTAPRLARRRATAHDGAACSSRSSSSRGSSSASR